MEPCRLQPHNYTLPKNEVIGQIGVASSDFKNNALDMAKCFLTISLRRKEEVFHRIEALTAQQTPTSQRDVFENYLSNIHI